MNLKQINEFRAAHGLAPLTGDANKAAKARQRNANLAQRAQESLDLRSVRSSNRKG